MEATKLWRQGMIKYTKKNNISREKTIKALWSLCVILHSFLLSRLTYTEAITQFHENTTHHHSSHIRHSPPIAMSEWMVTTSSAVVLDESILQLWLLGHNGKPRSWVSVAFFQHTFARLHISTVTTWLAIIVALEATASPDPQGSVIVLR